MLFWGRWTRPDPVPLTHVAHTCIRGRNAQTMQKMVFKGGPGLRLLFRTYSIRICLQKLTESRIFTNAAFFISTRWHSRSLVLQRTWLSSGGVSRTFGRCWLGAQAPAVFTSQRDERLSDGYFTSFTFVMYFVRIYISEHYKGVW